MRLIRSYVKRDGRLTSGQKKALDKYWNKYGINFDGSQLDLTKIFSRVAPLILDIGSGMGETTIEIASEYPENNYLSIEVHKPGVGSLLRQIKNNNLTNIRIMSHDVVEILHNSLPDKCIDSVYIFFPDPWPKKKHYKRRLINTGFLEILMKKLKPNARIYISTDLANYAEQILEVFSNNRHFMNLSATDNYAPRPRWRPYTKFELRGKKLGHDIFDIAFRYIDKSFYINSAKS